MQSDNTSRLSRRDFLRASAGLTGVVFLAACAPGQRQGLRLRAVNRPRRARGR